MFEVGFSELLLIAVIGLLVLGPQKLPGLARQVGRWMGRARTMARQFRDQLDEESFLEETKLNTSANKTDNKDNKIVPPAIAAAAVVAAPTEEKSDIPAMDMSSGTLVTGIPPDDDFAHHDPAGADAGGADAGNMEAPVADPHDEPKSA
jgi:sec-independent protein translocase protein TatB